MSIQETMEKKLKEAFSPERLTVINESHLHAGHHHARIRASRRIRRYGETHFRIRIVSAGICREEPDGAPSRGERLLADELRAGVHALAIEPAAPGEKDTVVKRAV